jgi:uncharacterized protein Yka (UPF0111/DUF47 family)
MTTDVARRTSLMAKLLIASHEVKSLIYQIKEIEADTRSALNEKLSKIKKIREEISKVGTEIDNLKREITLLNTYNVN